MSSFGLYVNTCMYNVLIHLYIYPGFSIHQMPKIQLLSVHCHGSVLPPTVKTIINMRIEREVKSSKSKPDVLASVHFKGKSY